MRGRAAVPERLRGVLRDADAAAQPGSSRLCGRQFAASAAPLSCRCRRPGTRRSREPPNLGKRRQPCALSRHRSGREARAPERGSQAGALLPLLCPSVCAGLGSRHLAPALRRATLGLGTRSSSLLLGLVRSFCLRFSSSLSTLSLLISKIMSQTTWKDRNLVPYPPKPCSECQINKWHFIVKAETQGDFDVLPCGDTLAQPGPQRAYVLLDNTATKSGLSSWVSILFNLESFFSVCKSLLLEHLVIFLQYYFSVIKNTYRFIGVNLDNTKLCREENNHFSANNVYFELSIFPSILFFFNVKYIFL